MKKVAIILALLLFQTQIACIAATNANYNKKPAQRTQANTKQVKQQYTNKAKQNNNDDDYLLKYNINDLEAAPWLNGGKRKI